MSLDDFGLTLPDPVSLPVPTPVTPLDITGVLRCLRRVKRRELIKELIREVAHDANFDLTEFVTKDDVENAVKEVIEDTRRTENFLTMSDLEHYVDHDLDLSDYVKTDDLSEEIQKELDDNTLIQKTAEGTANGLMQNFVLRRDHDFLLEQVKRLVEIQSKQINHSPTVHGLLADAMRTLGFWRRLKLVFFGRV